MRNLIDLNKEWFDKSNEFVVHWMKRSGDTYLKDISFLNLKRDMYFALSNLMAQLSDGRLSLISRWDSERKAGSPDAALHKFREEALEIFSRFEIDRSYENRGFVEATVDLMGRKSHSVFFGRFSKGDLSGLQRIMERFWIDFFKLKNSGKSDADDVAKSLLGAFENAIRKELTNEDSF